MSKPGDVIAGKYEILKEVGRGGMSIVYLAMDIRLNKQWAIKEVKRKASNSENQIVVQSLLVEANLMKNLDHPNLPRIVDIIENGSIIYIVMDYIEGESLDKLLTVKGAQDEDAVIEWGKQLAEVLDYLHTRRPPIIYRDMKPANAMLCPDGKVKIIDFGIAREYKEQNTADTVSLGTKGYAAPEQFGGMGQTDARTDVYCLGVTLYHLVTGKNPTEPPYEIQPIRSINPKLSSGLEAIIEKCIQLNPDDRFQSCAELLYALNNLNEYSFAYKKRQKRKLKGFIFSVATTFVMALVGVGCFVGYKTTLSREVQDIIAVYGSESTEDGKREQLVEYLEDKGGELSQEDLNNLIVNCLEVAEDDFKLIKAEHSSFITRNSNEGISEDEKTQVDGEENRVWTDLLKVERYIKNMTVNEYRSQLYYWLGDLYLDYYKMCEGMYNTEYISKRYEEAGVRFREVDIYAEKESEEIGLSDDETEEMNKGVSLSEDEIEYAKNIAILSECITILSDEGGVSGDNELSDEEKNQVWKKINGCFDYLQVGEWNESNKTKRVNTHLVISSILMNNRNSIKTWKLDTSSEGVRDVSDAIDEAVASVIEGMSLIDADESGETKDILLKKIETIQNSYNNAKTTIAEE